MENFLTARVHAHHDLRPGVPFIIVEIGTYCGYSAALMARTLQKCIGSSSFHIVTVDVDPQCIHVAQQFHQVAGLSKDNFSYLLQDGTSSLGTRIKTALVEKFNSVWTSNNLPPVSLVFLDHLKDDYLPDLKHLEDEGIIRANCAVAADNVVFFQLDEYRNYVQELANWGIVTTKLEEGQLEYIREDEMNDTTENNVWQDGVELTIYVKDPPSR